MILISLKYFQISFICIFWLSTLYAQPIYYEFELDQEYRIKQVNAIIDPYMHSTEVIWVKNERLNLRNLIIDTIPILIRKDVVTKKGKEWVVVEDIFGVSSKIIDNSGYTANELRILFDNIESLMLWTQIELGNTKGDFTYKWSKREIKNINAFLLKPNDTIIRELLIDEKPLSELEYNSIDFWLWFRKYSFYLYNPFVLIDVDSVYADKINSRLSQQLFTVLLPMMRLSNYKQLLSLSLSKMEVSELIINNLRENSLLSDYYYSSFLYCLRKYYPIYESNINYQITKDTIVIDTNRLVQYNLPIFEFVLRMYRHKELNVSLEYEFIDQLLDSVRFSEILNSKVTVLEFWGTWCKPCLKSMPQYLELATKYQGRIPFISIAIDKSDKWLKYLSSNRLSPSMQLLCQNDISGFYTPGISIFPTYMVIDEHGKLLGSPVNSIEELKVNLEKIVSN
jgi:cytochrome c biogenesis protein CcmG/thiol:disulfide interchange protein DsbE